MRELRNCDFCDDDAVGTFAVVPPELEPTEDEQRRVVLCDGCKGQLQTLLEPLLARAGVDDGDDGTESTASESGSESDATDGEPDDGGSGTVVAAADESTQARNRSSSPNATVSEPESGRSTDDGGAGDGESGDGGSDDESAARARDGSRVSSGITIERSGGDADEATDRAPKAYGKVLRLLENREFPMDRHEAQQLAAGAYDLEPHEVAAIIDRAIERGEFVEKRDELRRPDD